MKKVLHLLFRSISLLMPENFSHLLSAFSHNRVTTKSDFEKKKVLRINKNFFNINQPWPFCYIKFVAVKEKELYHIFFQLNHLLFILIRMFRPFQYSHFEKWYCVWKGSRHKAILIVWKEEMLMETWEDQRMREIECWMGEVIL